MGLPIIGDLIDGVTGIIDKVIPDADKKNEIKLELEKLGDQADQRLHDELMGQIEVNKVEASQRSIFIAGWRPFIGWVGGCALAWSFILSPIFEWLSRLFGWHGDMPMIDASQLSTIVLAMLGVGAMRSYDKKQGTSNDILKAPIQYPPDEPGKPKSIIPINIPWLK